MRDQGTRRDFFSTIADGLHGVALASLLSASIDPALGASALEHGASPSLAPKQPHHEPKAKSIIHLFQGGGPSQIDLIDPKPAVAQYEGKTPGRDLAAVIASPDQAGGFFPSPYSFKRYGQSGLEVSELMPHFAECVDDVALIRSMVVENPNHEQALFHMHTGRTVPDRPTLGSWISYGLGTENQNLPAYLVLEDPKGMPLNGIQNWQSSYLPPIYQGTRLRSEGQAPILNLESNPELPGPLVDAQRDLLSRLDLAHAEQRPYYPSLQGRISSYELAARMQMAASDALDISKESEATKEMYGLNDALTHSYGKRCLMARRLVERGVRFVQLFIELQIWDAHDDIDKSLRYSCGKTDKPIAGLLKDLKQRGLLDETLVVWGGEFGRLPVTQNAGKSQFAGRDHNPAGFPVWLAGGGVKAGTIYGATDELGFKTVEGATTVHDYHATLMHLMGLDYRRVTFHRHGLDERITDQFPARIVEEIIA